MKRFVSYLSLFALAMLLVMPLSADQKNKKLAEGLSLVAKDAMGIVVVKDLKSMDEKLSKWVAEMAKVVPMLQGAADMKFIETELLEKQFGVTEGLDMEAPMLIVFDKSFNPDDEENDGDKHVFILLGVSDFEKFAGNFGETGESFSFQFADTGEDSFARKVGNFALIGPDKELVKAYKPGNNAARFYDATGKLNRDLLTKSDAFVQVDVQSIATIVKPEIEAMLEDIEHGEAMEDEAVSKVEKMEKAIGKMILQSYETFFDDSESFIMAVTIADDGLHVDSGIQFKEDSKLAKAISGAGKADYEAFNKHAASDYIMAVDYDISGFEELRPWITKFTSTMMEAMGEEVKKDEKALMKNFVEVVTKADAASHVWLASKNPTPSNMFRNDMVVVSKDADGIRKNYKDLVGLANKLMDKQAKENDEPKPMTMTYTEKVMQIDGKDIDQLDMKMTDDVLGQMGPGAVMFGEGFKVNIAAFDKYFVTSMNNDAVGLKNVFAGVKEGGLHKNESIVAMRKQLPEHRFMEAYLNLGSVVKMVLAIAKQFDQEMAIEVPEKVEPIAMSASAKDGALRSKLIIPLSTQKMVAQVGMTFWMMNMGMGGGGGFGEPMEEGF